MQAIGSFKTAAANHSYHDYTSYSSGNHSTLSQNSFSLDIKTLLIIKFLTGEVSKKFVWKIINKTCKRSIALREPTGQV